MNPEVIDIEPTLQHVVVTASVAGAIISGLGAPSPTSQADSSDMSPSQPALAAMPTRIEDVDFRNRAYDLHGQSVLLIHGQYEARTLDEYSVLGVEVSYGDLTADGRSEAIVILRYHGGGTGSFSIGYLF